jgi:hypothetical protein
MQSFSQLLTEYHSKAEVPTQNDRDEMVATLRRFVVENLNSHEMPKEDGQVMEDMTDSLIRCMEIPSIRSDMSDLIQVIIAIRIATRHDDAKTQFNGLYLIFELMEQYKDPLFHLESWKMIYNVCMEDSQKDTFIRMKGMDTMKKSLLLFITDRSIMSEICEFCTLLSIGKDARFRLNTLYEYGTIFRVLAILTHYRDDVDMVKKAFSALRYLLYNYGSEQVAVENGAQYLICELLLRHRDPILRKKGIVVLQNLFSLDSSHSTSVAIIDVVMELFRQATQKEEIDQLILFVGNLSCWHDRSNASYIVFSINDFIPSSIASRFVETQERWSPITNEEIDKMHQRFMRLTETTKPSLFYEIPDFDKVEEIDNPYPHKTTLRSYIYYSGANGLVRRPRCPPFLTSQNLDQFGSFAPFAHGGDTEAAIVSSSEPSSSLGTIEEDQEDVVSVDVPDVSECKTITEILMKVFQKADEKRAVRFFYAVRLAAKTQAVAEDLVRRGLLSMLVKPTFSQNKRVARNACAALYALASNSSEESLMPVEEMKGFTVNEEMLLDFISKLGGASSTQKETAIRVLILCGFSFHMTVFIHFPSLASFYKEIQEKMTKKNTEFMSQISSSPVDVLGLVAGYLNFSTPFDPADI